MTFDAEIRHWRTPEDLAGELSTRMPPTWATGITIHHTVKPLPENWQGHRSMGNLVRYYRDSQGWPSGPHLFLAYGSAHPDDDGVWQLTPLGNRGTHAGACNGSRWGLEVVGNFQHTPWGQGRAELVERTMTVLLRWAGLRQAEILGHRECMRNRECPGAAIDLGALRASVQARLAAAVGSGTPYTEQSPIIGLPEATKAQALAYLLRRGPWGEYTATDVEVIVNEAWRLAASRGVDPVIAIAQIVHETDGLRSWWAARPRRNPAGIGVTGRMAASDPKSTAWARDERTGVWRQGLSFSGWVETAIPAQIGRLLAYALTPAQQAMAPAPTRALIAQALGVRTLPLALHGSAPVIRALGAAHNPTRQGWASPGDAYGVALGRIAEAIRRTEV